MYKNLPFDLEKRHRAADATCSSSRSRWLVNTELSARSVADLVAVAKAKPKTLNYSAPARCR